jgi:hypothetical protein
VNKPLRVTAFEVITSSYFFCGEEAFDIVEMAVVSFAATGTFSFFFVRLQLLS